MKILSLVYPSPWEPLRNDAMMWRIFNIKKIMETQGHEVDLVCYMPNYLYKKFQPIQPLEDTVFKTALIPNLKYLRDLKNYDIIYSNTSWSGFNSLFGKFFKSPPIISDFHGIISEEFKQSRYKNNFSSDLLLILRKCVDHSCANFSNKLVCVSRKMINYFNIYWGIPLEKMHYVTNGVNLDFFKPMDYETIAETKRAMGLENKLIIGYIGDSQKWQGLDNFISASQQIEDNSLAFLFVGGDKQARIKNIIFIPRVSRLLLLKYYSICDILVIPRPNHAATEVAAPTKFAEYASMGKPILSTNVGDAAELIRKYKCGIIVENNKISNLIDGINAFRDLAERDLRTMGSNSRTLAKKEFNWNNQAHELKLCLESAYL